MKKTQKRGKPGPTQLLRPPHHEETDQAEWQKRQRALGRQRGAEKKHLNAQFRGEVLAEIVEYCRHHPGASNNAIARWLQNHLGMKRLVAHPNGEDMTERAVANKVGRVRPAKIKRVRPKRS